MEEISLYEEKKTDILAILSLVGGIMSLVGGILLWLPSFLGIVSFVLGFLSLSNIKKNDSLEGKGLAITGIITSCIALFIAILPLIIIIIALLIGSSA